MGLTRQEKEKFIRESAEYFEHHTNVDWTKYSDEEIDKWYEWFDYLWDK